jgi:hypothetical protein
MKVVEGIPYGAPNNGRHPTRFGMDVIRQLGSRSRLCAGG